MDMTPYFNAQRAPTEMHPNIPLVCTTLLPSMTAFGTRMDTGEQVFIPSSVVRTMNVSLDEEYIVTVVPNPRDEVRAKTPWMVTRLQYPAKGTQVDAPAEPVVPTEPVQLDFAFPEADDEVVDEAALPYDAAGDTAPQRETGGATRGTELGYPIGSVDAILAFVRDRRYVTTSEISAEFNANPKATNNALRRMQRLGLMVRADVYATATQKRASFCLWALDTADFLA